MLAAILIAQTAVLSTGSSPSYRCLMVNPVGDRLVFSIASDTASAFRISAEPGSGWPRRTIPVSSIPANPGGEGTRAIYAIGSGPQSRHLVVERSGKATVYGLNDGARVLPLAVGFCSDMPNESTDLSASSTSADPFAASAWQNSCTFVARSGFSAAIRYQRLSIDAVEIGDTSRTVWSRSPYRLRVSNENAMRLRFRSTRPDTAPSGTEEFFVLGAFASKVIEFETLGPDSMIGQQAAVAICGHTGVTMRATRQ